ncbi:MAG: SUMF1/EgtB/PvdO family nonheme iron enzyme, partial [Planctomycetaceae bacterium]|nr:SUMF1/EgtB/PvdO family nonheme iron enzyme [Planctomycetaceae bacterium]
MVQITRDVPRDPQKLNPEADPALCDVALTMMSKEIEKRPASMQEIVDRLSDSQFEHSLQSGEKDRKKNERRQKLEIRKRKVAELIQRGQYAQAVTILEKMSGITSADAVGYANWARQELKRVQELPRKVREGIPVLVEMAQELIKKHDYGQAAEMLQEIPQEMRTFPVQQQLKQVIELQDEVDLLLTELHECVKTKQCEGIEENIARLLQLKPNNRFARNLQETLQTYSAIPVSQREYRYDENGDLLALEPTIRRTLIASVIIGLFLFGFMTYAMSVYLSGDDKQSLVQVKESPIDDRGVQKSETTEPNPKPSPLYLRLPKEDRPELKDPDVTTDDVSKNSSHKFNSNVQVSRTTPLQPTAEDSFAGKQIKDRWSKNFLKTTFLWIPPGKFRMGSVQDVPLDRHEQPVDVEISHGLWVQQMELTQSEWRKLVGLTPWMPFTDKQANDRNAAPHMTWDEAVDFCQRLTDRDRRLGNLPNNWEYRLPSEAEWEYFCRAGTTSTYSFGDNVQDL